MENEICRSARTVGELREAIKDLPADMKLDFSAGCYRDADHYCSEQIKRWNSDIGDGVEVCVETEEVFKLVPVEGKKRKREVSETVLRVSNGDWGAFRMD